MVRIHFQEVLSLDFLFWIHNASWNKQVLLPVTFCHWLHPSQALLITPTHIIGWRHCAIIFSISHIVSLQVPQNYFRHVLLQTKSPVLVPCCCQELPSEDFWQPNCQSPEQRNDASLSFKRKRGKDSGRPTAGPNTFHLGLFSILPGSSRPCSPVGAIRPRTNC